MWHTWGYVTPAVKTQKTILHPPSFLALRMLCLPLGTWHQTVSRCSAHWPSNASSQQAASTTRPAWASLVRVTPVPRLQVLQLGARQCGTVTSPPHCAFSEFLTHTNHDIMNDDGCLRPLDFWDNWLCSNRKRKHFVSKEHR